MRADYLGIDLGTSSIKIGRFDGGGEMVARIALGYREPDEVQVEFERIWECVVDGCRELLGSTSSHPPVGGISISSQTNSFALVGPEGRPITPVMLWLADAAGPQAELLQERLGAQALAQATGMTRLTGQLLAPKCLYLARLAPEAWAGKSSIALLPDLLMRRLCGRNCTSHSLWSLTGLYDLEAQGWWQSMLGELDLEARCLPELMHPGQVAGRLLRQPARSMGLPKGIPLVVGTLDHLAAAIGAGNTAAGQASLSTGTTSCVVVTHAQRPAALEGGVVGRHPAQAGAWYALTWSGLSSTGLNWCARQCGGELKLAELLEQAGRLSAGDCGWRAVPQDPNNGEAGFTFEPPERQPSGPEAMRAVLECLTEEISRLLKRASGGTTVEHLVVAGGGAQSDAWLRLLADRLEMNVTRADCIEAAVRGAALMASGAVGSVPSS